MTAPAHNVIRALVMGSPTARRTWVDLLKSQQWYVSEQSDWLDTLPHLSYVLVILLIEESDAQCATMIRQLKQHFPQSYFCAVLLTEHLDQLPALFQVGLDDYVLASAPSDEREGRVLRLSYRLHQSYISRTAQSAHQNSTPSNSAALKQFPYLASHHLRQTCIRIRHQLETLIEKAPTPLQKVELAQLLERTNTMSKMLNAALGDTPFTLRSSVPSPPMTHQDYVIVDPQLKVQQYSEGVQQYAEADAPVRIGHSIQESFPELTSIETLVSDLFSGQTKGYELSGVARHKGTEYPLYFDLYINVYTQPSNFQQSVSLIVLLNNATERMLFQQQLIQSANEAQLLLRKLEASRHYITQIINSMADALIVTTQSGIIKKTNPAAQRLFGYQSYEMLAQPITKFVTDQAFLAQVAEGTFTTPTEVTCLRRDQEHRYISFSCGTIRTEEDIQEFVYVGRDITERKLAEAKIRQLNESLQARTQDLEVVNAELEVVNEELESFSRTVSHDLRTPLSHIDFFNQMLLEEFASELPAEAQDYILQIRQAGHRMQQLIHDLLELSRATRIALTCETVDLSAIAGPIIEQLHSNAPDREYEFVVPKELLVWGSPALLRIVLENLLQNAWKYSGKETSTRIELGSCSTNEMPISLDYEGQIFFVRDNGVGFDMNHANKLFKTFSRLHSARDFEGTGIGLTTVQRIIHRHGGQIWAEATVGQGATFYFTLASGVMAAQSYGESQITPTVE